MQALTMIRFSHITFQERKFSRKQQSFNTKRYKRRLPSVDNTFIIYHILRHLAKTREIEEGSEALKWEMLNVSKEEFADIVHWIQQEGLIRKASIIKREQTVKMIFLAAAEITREGNRYLEQLSQEYGKNYKGKEIS